MRTNNSNLSNITHIWVDILMPFLSNYELEISGSEISRKTNIPQQTVSRVLDELVSRNFLNFKMIGKNKIFYFDLRNEKTKLLINILENNKSLNFLSNFKNEAVIISEILKFSESIIIFGSYSSFSNSKNSDLDIVIFGKYDNSLLKKIKERNDIQINEHNLSYAEFIKSLNQNNSLAIEIKNNHTLFGDVSKLVNIFLESLK